MLPLPNPAPTKYFFSAMCHPTPRKEVSSPSKRVCIGAGVSGGTHEGKRDLQSFNRPRKEERGEEGGDGAGESMPDTSPVVPGPMMRRCISEADGWTRKGGREGAGDPEAVSLAESRGPCWGSVRGDSVMDQDRVSALPCRSTRSPPL